MVSLIDFYFHFQANFQTLTSPNMFSIFTHVKAYVKLVRDTNSEPGLPVAITNLKKLLIISRHVVKRTSRIESEEGFEYCFRGDTKLIETMKC